MRDCIMCGDELPHPEYELDPPHHEYCSYECVERKLGRDEGMQLLQAIQDWGYALKARFSTRQCVKCGYDQLHRQPNKDYDSSLYLCTDGNAYCGPCADNYFMQDVEVIESPFDQTEER